MLKFVCAGLILSLSAAAQESRGTIAGRVADQQGMGIPKAQVVITNVETGVDTSLETNDQGAYSAPLLIPGNYKIAVKHGSFKRFARSGVTLSINDSLR